MWKHEILELIKLIAHRFYSVPTVLNLSCIMMIDNAFIKCDLCVLLIVYLNVPTPIIFSSTNFWSGIKVYS